MNVNANSSREEVRAEILGNFNSQLIEARLSLDCLAVNDCTYIVKAEEEALQFTPVHGRADMDVRVTTVAKATRYTSHDGAQRIANQVKNGRGARGHIVKTRDALVDDIAKLEKLIADIQAA